MKTINGEMSVWWLSFVHPGSDTFAGVCVVEASDIVAATARANDLGISPGGQVLGVTGSAEFMESMLPRKHWYRLLSKQDLMQVVDGELVRTDGTEVK